MNDNLGFVDLACDAFAFLVESYGYSVEVSTPTSIVFRSSSVRVVVAFDARRSYELDVIAGRITQGLGPEYRLDEILGSLGVPEGGQWRTPQVTTRAALETFLRKMADLLREYGGDLLGGSAVAFAEVERYRMGRSQRYAAERQLRRAKERAVTAWRSERYAEVVEVLSPVMSMLSKSDAKRLEIARRRVGESEST